MADHHQQYCNLDIDCYPKLPHLISQKKHLTPKEDLIFPALKQHYKEHHATASVVFSLQALETTIPNIPYRYKVLILQLRFNNQKPRNAV
jgi:hypothetical protein